MPLTSHQISVFYEKLNDADIKKIFHAFKRCTVKKRKKQEFIDAIKQMLDTYEMLMKFINQQLKMITPEYKIKEKEIENTYVEDLRHLHMCCRQALVNRKNKRDKIHGIIKLCQMLEKYVEN